MNYFIKRELQEYGPYTLAELQRYVGTGNVLVTDMCRSEGMTDWMPVSQVIGTIPVPAASPAPSAIAAAPASIYPPPPSLHWGIAVLLGVITCGLFGWVWAFVQAAWMKKVMPESKALLYYGIAVSLMIAYIVTIIAEGRANPGFSILFRLVGGIMWIVAAFNMRSSIEDHFTSVDRQPMGLTLNGVMTFFFNVYYFQYHFTKINEMKRAQGIYV